MEVKLLVHKESMEGGCHFQAELENCSAMAIFMTGVPQKNSASELHMSINRLIIIDEKKIYGLRIGHQQTERKENTRVAKILHAHNR